MTTFTKHSLSALLNDATLEDEILGVFKSHGAQPKKDLGFEIRKHLPAEYRQLGDSEAVFRAISRHVNRLLENGLLEINPAQTHYRLVPDEPEQPDSAKSQTSRKSTGRNAGRQNLVGASAH